MIFFCNTGEHGQNCDIRFSQQLALSRLVAKYGTSWWLKLNLVFSSIIGQKMNLLAITNQISQGFEKTPNMAQIWPKNGFLTISLEPNHLGPKFLHFWGPHTWLDQGDTLSQFFWKSLLVEYVELQNPAFLNSFQQLQRCVNELFLIISDDKTKYIDEKGI